MFNQFGLKRKHVTEMCAIVLKITCNIVCKAWLLCVCGFSVMHSKLLTG